MTSERVLPPRLQIFYDLFVVGKDVPISTLYAALKDEDHDDPRYAQQYLGSYIIRLNRRLKPVRQRVEPGALKHTYRLVRV